MMINEAKAILAKSPAATELVDNFESGGGGTFVIDEKGQSRGAFSPESNVIRINPRLTYSPEEAAGVLLFELLRFKHSAEQQILDMEAKENLLDRETYATQCEKLGYKCVREHHEIAHLAVKNTSWPQSMDVFAVALKYYDTWEKWSETLKGSLSAHHAVFLDRYDLLHCDVDLAWLSQIWKIVRLPSVSR
ncbi:hypothetical protein AYO44_14610 [Planctomycetaceae bacterium SCGC AG-212-F19]|nr:hypothetical protein AYO44_14610 [Planctomycetaceae bacterium SCGC AG-212-F19]